MIEEPLSSVDAWICYFSEAQLPALRHTVHELDLLRENAEKVNARVLSGIILRDPLMALRVLDYIEKRRNERQTTDITTIERALMMIGIDPFFRDFQSLPRVEDQLREYPKALVGVIKVMGRARKAAHWARDWAIIRHDLDVDEITVATLLHDVAEILMWSFAPSLALKVREIQGIDRSRRTADIQTEVYGASLYQITIGLAKAWRLPTLIGMLLDDANAANPRVRNVKLAVDLARHSANGWDDAALPDDFKGIQDLVHVSHETLLHKLGLDKDPVLIQRLAENAAQQSVSSDSADDRPGED